MFWTASSFVVLLYLSSANLRDVKFPILKKEEVCILKTRQEHSVQHALSHNGLPTVISAFCNSTLKYSFFSLYINPTNRHHYHTSVSAMTKHTFEKEVFVQ